jgi:hypothetical protein
MLNNMLGHRLKVEIPGFFKRKTVCMKLQKQHEPGDGEIVAALGSLHGFFFPCKHDYGRGDS